MTISTYKDMGESQRPYAEQKMLYTKRAQILYMKFQKGQIYLGLWLSRGKRMNAERSVRKLLPLSKRDGMAWKG